MAHRRRDGIYAGVSPMVVVVVLAINVEAWVAMKYRLSKSGSSGVASYTRIFAEMLSGLIHRNKTFAGEVECLLIFPLPLVAESSAD